MKRRLLYCTALWLLALPALAVQQAWVSWVMDGDTVMLLPEGEHEAAVDYLDRMLLQATPDSRWADAARTNLAQAYLGLGRIDDAIRMLREDGSPQRFGSRLLADRLERDHQTR